MASSKTMDGSIPDDVFQKEADRFLQRLEGKLGNPQSSKAKTGARKKTRKA